jgi:hypothetical protein
MYPCKWNRVSSENNVSCWLISPSTTDCRNQLQKWTLLAGLRYCKVWISGVLKDLSFSNCVGLLALDFWHSNLLSKAFKWFCRLCSSLASMSSNFLSVSTRRLCFCFLSVKRTVALSLFTKLWIICLLGTLSSRNLPRNFRRHFVSDLYFTQVS